SFSYFIGCLIHLYPLKQLRNQDMASNCGQNVNSSTRHTETSTRSEEYLKWDHRRERIFLELYDQALAMNYYRLKDPSPLGKKFIVDKFNQEFNLDINYKFFREKLDQMKRKYKKYTGLMQNSTGISVDPVTSVISASDSWWKDREVCRIIKSFKRKPPEFWDIMQRCFKLYDVCSQSQYSVNQRREEMMNEGLANDESHMDSETFADDMPQTQVPETQKSEEVYRVNISDQTRPSSEFSREPIRQSSPPELSFQNNASRGQQQGRTRRESGATRVGGSSRASARTSSRGSRKKQSFQTTLTDTMDGFREFQRQSLQQLRPRSRRRGGLFNIWGKKQGPNLNESHQSESEDED
ncbi:unnamed protein product, partial [Brassica oleracea]